MKLETEAGNTSCLFISSERTNGKEGSSVVGCSVRAGDRFPFAQGSSPSIGGIASTASADIDRPPASDGCGASVCGSRKANGFHNDILSNNPTPSEEASCFATLNCEHFRFIDDDDEDENANPPNQPLQLERPCNGVSSDQQSSPSLEEKIPATNGDLPDNSQNLPKDHGKAQVEVSDCVALINSKNFLETTSIPTTTKMSECGGAKENVAPNSTGKNCRQLKSVLKKGKSSENGKRGRVTFDEAVMLYSDDFDEVQLLALRSGPDFTCAEVFYMFEPPIEYQDLLLPFEPPAEYRDPECKQEEAPLCETVIITTDASQTDQSVVQADSISDSGDQDSENNGEANRQLESCGDIRESETNDDQNNSCEHLAKEQQQQQIDPNEGSERLFERFLEAEREFAEDEELNRVFHALEGDMSCEDKNGTFDDTFFKKLITLLSSVEGDVQMPENDLLSAAEFVANDVEIREIEEDDNSQTHSRTISEADSDCSVSSQDTIIVRLDEDDHTRASRNDDRDRLVEDLSRDLEGLQNYDDVFNETIGTAEEETTAAKQDSTVLPNSQPMMKDYKGRIQTMKYDPVNNSVDRQCNAEEPIKEIIQDADDSTSSDSRSGEVEEDIRLDDIGYDEEDAEDYDEEACLRGMVRGNSKIRRIIKKNALQCTLMRGLDARRRQQPGAKYPRPKSPLLPQESLVEQLKWLTTVEENKDSDGLQKFSSKPPDVILSTGSVPLNGPRSHCAPSEDADPTTACYLPMHYAAQERRVVARDSQGVYIVQPSGYPVPPGARPVRPWMTPANQVLRHPIQQPYPSQRPHPMPPRMIHPDERFASQMPRDFRDWRVIQRVMVNRGNGNIRPFVATGFRRCPNGTVNVQYRLPPPDVSRLPNVAMGNDELEQFVQQGSQRNERIRKRYSVAEDDDDPTFGFARRPSVRGVQNRMPPAGAHYQPSDGPMYATLDEVGQAESAMLPRIPPELEMSWNQSTNWRDGTSPYGAVGGSHTSTMPVHRASVALSELPGCATLPHPKSHSDARYHSYSESPYGNSQTLPHKRWPSIDPRTCASPGNLPATQQLVIPALPQPNLQVPSHALPMIATDERGVPEGASSSPKMSSDSLYHGPLPEALPVGGAHKDDGVIYYSMNV